VNAVPMTTATARSMRLPREMKFLKPFTYMTPWWLNCRSATPIDQARDGEIANLFRTPGAACSHAR
jgi:hypothetical protein